MQAVINSFREKGFPNTVGVVDGCYIEIPMPKENGVSYICRKNFPALILQVALGVLIFLTSLQ